MAGGGGQAQHALPRARRDQRGGAAAREADRAQHLGGTGPLSQKVQAGRKVLRIRHINGMEVRKKRTRVFKKRPRGSK